MSGPSSTTPRTSCVARSPCSVASSSSRPTIRVTQRPVAQGVASALEETDRLARLTEDLLTLARADAGQLEPGETMTELLGATEECIRRLPHRDDVRIEVFGDPHGRSRRRDLDPPDRHQPRRQCRAPRPEPDPADHDSSRRVRAAGRRRRRCGLPAATAGPGLRPFHPRRRCAHPLAEEAPDWDWPSCRRWRPPWAGRSRATNGPPFGGACVEVELPLARS